MLSGYQPFFYTEPMEVKKKRQEDRNTVDLPTSVLEDDIQRDKFLVKMMYILMVKRLESSWYSFYSTVEKILAHHQNVLQKIKQYQLDKKSTNLLDRNEAILFEDFEAEDEMVEFTLGKKGQVNLSDIEAAGNLGLYKRDLKKDIDALDNIITNLARFEAEVNKEVRIPNNLSSQDTKLEVLIKKVLEKRKSGENNNNPKVVIFTVYRDTAEYLFKQLNARGFTNMALVSGTGSRTTDNDVLHKYYEPILERFAPYTKLYREREWEFAPSHPDTNPMDQYNEWISWIADNETKTYKQLQNPIDILIATDALSEGQNLQDADMVINYDIHWNPVRIIQRMGRIDRLGSPNQKIFGVNFWPSNNINSYLDLQGRIEQRMAAMQLAGSEVQLEFSDTFKEMAEDENLENRMKARMMEQMQTSWDDIEISEQGLGFNDLSLEKYRQDLLEEYQRNTEKYTRMPKGVYTGFKAINDNCPEKGIIALLGFPSKPPRVLEYVYQTYDLIYIDSNGETVLLNQKEVLDALTLHKEEPRYIPESIDRGEENEIRELVKALENWLKKQAVEEVKEEDGTIKRKMGSEAKDLLSKLKSGDPTAIKRISQNIKDTDKYQIENFDLITWFLVS